MRPKISAVIVTFVLLAGATFWYLRFQKDNVGVLNQDVLKVGVLLHESSMPIFVAEANGYFLDTASDVQLVVLSPSDHMAALVSNRVDILSPTSFTALMGAMVNNPKLLHAIMPGAEVVDGETVYGIIVSKDSDISSIEELDRKRLVAINPFTKSNLQAILSHARVSTSTIPEIGVSTRELALSSLTSGDADAAIMDQPSIAVAIASGDYKLLISNPRARYIHSPYWSGAGAVTTKFWNSSPNKVKDFLSAIDRSIEFTKTNKKESQLILSEYLNLDPEVAEFMGGYFFPLSTEPVSLEEIKKTSNALRQAGLLQGDLALGTFFPGGLYD